jgi:hypothetical protein
MLERGRALQTCNSSGAPLLEMTGGEDYKKPGKLELQAS